MSRKYIILKILVILTLLVILLAAAVFFFAPRYEPQEFRGTFVRGFYEDLCEASAQGRAG